VTSRETPLIAAGQAPGDDIENETLQTAADDETTASDTFTTPRLGRFLQGVGRPVTGSLVSHENAETSWQNRV
jgi:hypothetical protein